MLVSLLWLGGNVGKQAVSLSSFIAWADFLREMLVTLLWLGGNAGKQTVSLFFHRMGLLLAGNAGGPSLVGRQRPRLNCSVSTECVLQVLFFHDEVEVVHFGLNQGLHQ